MTECLAQLVRGSLTIRADHSLLARCYRWCVARLFRVNLFGDVYERLAEWHIGPPLSKNRRNWHLRIERTRILFIHVPKTGGTSISRTLYGSSIRHWSARYYVAAIPKLIDSLTVFTVIRDPVERFLSAYCYSINGGGDEAPIAKVFRSKYMGLESVDQALDQIEKAASPYDLDPIFRRQTWFICKSDMSILPQIVIPFELLESVYDVVPGFPRRPLGHLNRRKGVPPQLSKFQIERIRRYYAEDVRLSEMAREGFKRGAHEKLPRIA